MLFRLVRASETEPDRRAAQRGAAGRAEPLPGELGAGGPRRRGDRRPTRGCGSAIADRERPRSSAGWRPPRAPSAPAASQLAADRARARSTSAPSRASRRPATRSTDQDQRPLGRLITVVDTAQTLRERGRRRRRGRPPWSCAASRSGQLAARVRATVELPERGDVDVDGVDVPRQHARGRRLRRRRRWTSGSRCARTTRLRAGRHLAAGDRRADRLPRPRDRLRDHRLAHAAGRDPAPARGRAADRPRRLLESRSRPRATTSSPRSATSSTRWRASSRPAWRSSSASARACRTRSGASASRSPRASTASACSRSWCRPRSTASRPTAAARRCAAAATTGCTRSPRTGDPAAYERALHAAEAAVLDAGQIAEIELAGASARSPRRWRRRGRRRRSASSPWPAATAASRPASASCSPT